MAHITSRVDNRRLEFVRSLFKKGERGDSEMIARGLLLDIIDDLIDSRRSPLPPAGNASIAVCSAHPDGCSGQSTRCVRGGEVEKERIGALYDWWKLSLVIESAVRRAEGHGRNHADVLAVIIRTQELVKRGALSHSPSGGSGSREE